MLTTHIYPPLFLLLPFILTPLPDVVLSTIMGSIPYPQPPRPLKEGYVADLTWYVLWMLDMVDLYALRSLITF